jgi:hypothetical protein
MKKAYLVLLISLFVLGVVSAGILGSGIITKNPDDTFTKSEQVTVVTSYPSLTELDKNIADCQLRLDKMNRAKELAYDKSTSQLDAEIFIMVAKEYDCSVQMAIWQEQRAEVKDVK